MSTKLRVISRVSGLMLLGVLHLVVISLSLYLTYGWLTINDIRSECRKNGYDTEKVLEGLIAPFPLHQNVNTNDGRPQHKWVFPPDNALLRRLRGSILFLNEQSDFEESADHNGASTIPAPETTTKTMDDGSVEFSTTIPLGLEGSLAGGVTLFQPLLPFLLMSSSTLDFLFCFGLGSFASYAILLAGLLTGAKLTSTYALLRPILGGVAAGLSFVTIQAGGSMIWTQLSSPNGVSLGLLSIAGAIYCERLPELMATSLRRSAQAHTDE